jgi:hypothetical protein
MIRIEDPRKKAEGEHASNGLGEKIVSLVTDYWQENHRPLLLSGLGIEIRRNSQLFRQLKIPLRAFVKDISELKIVTDPRAQQRIGLIPSDVAMPENIEELFGNNDRKTIPRYDHGFWRAFQNPINERRFVQVSNDVFKIYDAREAIKDHTFEILASDVCLSIDAEIPPRPSEVNEKILGWLKKNNLSDSIFLYKPNAITTGGRIYENSRAAFLGRLGELPADDLKRINIPLDIVLKIADKLQK